MDPKQNPADIPADTVPPPVGARRRLLRGGLAAAPVLMTLASRPVLGQTACAAPSAFTSAASGAARTTSVCTGLSPRAWKAHLASWPSPYCGVAQNWVGGHPATLYHCPTTGLGGRVYGDRTMLEVIDINEAGGDNSAVGRYIVAALLNARSGRTPVLTETTVRNMWNDLVNRGYFEPTAGIRWTAPEIIAYLKTTMT
jgi:hypothetical protein